MPAWEPNDLEIKNAEKLGGLLTQDQLADFFGVTIGRLQYALKINERLRNAYDKGRATTISKVAKNLVQKALDGNVTCMIFYLKTQAGWWDTQKIENNSVAAGENAETEETARREVLGRLALIAKRIEEESVSDGADGGRELEGSEVRLDLLGETRPASA